MFIEHAFVLGNRVLVRVDRRATEGFELGRYDFEKVLVYGARTRRGLGCAGQGIGDSRGRVTLQLLAGAERGRVGAETQEVNFMRQVKGMTVGCALEEALQVMDVHVCVLERLAGSDMEVAADLIDRKLAVHIAALVGLLRDTRLPALTDTLLKIVFVLDTPARVCVGLSHLIAGVAAPVVADRLRAVAAAACVLVVLKG